MEFMDELCPTCNSKNTDCFYRLERAPVTSVGVMSSRNEALNVERKNITLSLCNNCGLIFNSSYDNSLDYFTRGYEDQQGFSQTFNNFITGVTQEFIDKYNVYDKLILEIGCGKGDFLKLISNLGNNKGIGIDPSFEPDRGDSNDKVSFIKEFYKQEHGIYNPDCICCRHTLEHIPQTSQFITLIRNSMNRKKEPVLFFEVPDAIRILDKQAFWDIYYEHANYFSPGSLARLFRLNNFEVLDLYTRNDDQYLFIEAKPSDKILTQAHPHEESVDFLRILVNQFKNRVEKNLVYWRKKLKQLEEKNKKVVLWGGGSKSVGFLTRFDDIPIFNYVIDINPYLKEKYIPGIGIQYKSPEFLAQYQPDDIIIMNSVYKEEIAKMLFDININPKLHYLD